MTATSNWTIARHRMGEDITGTLVLWVPFALVVGAVIFGIAYFGTVGTSIWEKASQVPRWYAGAVGIHMTALYLPAYIAHGVTRREFARQAPVALLAFCAALAALMTLGFAIESFVYRIAGWPQTLSSPHLFDSVSQYPMVFAEFWLAFTVWAVGGLLLGAAFYRDNGLGFLMIPVAVAALFLIEGSLGTDSTFNALPPVLTFLDLAPEAVSLPRAAGVAAGWSVVGGGLTWLIVRTLPVRNQSA